MTWNGGYQGSGGASSRARLLIPVLHLLFEKSDGQYLPVPIPFDRVLTQLGKRRVSLPLLFFLSLPPIFSRKTFPSSANIFFFFCKRLEKKPRYLKDKRERERERSFPGARRVHHNRRLSIIARRRGKRGNVEWHPIEARAVARRSLSLRDSRALELIRVPWHTSGQIKFRF